MTDLCRRSLGIALCVALASAAPAADLPGRITGVGGIFVRSKNPKALMAWYRDVLGIKLEPWGGAALPTDAPGHPPVVTVAAFEQASGYFAPSTCDFMIDLAVDDLSAVLDRLKAKGVAVLKREDGAVGDFAWIVDPDGTKVELWQPKPKPAAK